MRAVVVYESMYGNTHVVAEAIGAGLEGACDVTVLPAEKAAPQVVAGADLLVVGGPTHVHGMSRPSTRTAAVEAAEKPASGLHMEEGAATGPGVREWLDRLSTAPPAAAAFDTRMKGPAMLTGQASHGISKALHKHGARELVPPESFLVTKENRLVDGELERARQWGERLGTVVAGR